MTGSEPPVDIPRPIVLGDISKRMLAEHDASGLPPYRNDRPRPENPPNA